MSFLLGAFLLVILLIVVAVGVVWTVGGFDS